MTKTYKQILNEFKHSKVFYQPIQLIKPLPIACKTFMRTAGTISFSEEDPRPFPLIFSPLQLGLHGLFLGSDSTYENLIEDGFEIVPCKFVLLNREIEALQYAYAFSYKVESELDNEDKAITAIQLNQHGFSYREIAQIMNISFRTVRMYLQEDELDPFNQVPEFD